MHHCLSVSSFAVLSNVACRKCILNFRSHQLHLALKSCEPRHYKTNKMSVRRAKTQISMGIRQVWSESSLSAWRNLGSLATSWAHSEDSDQTVRMPRLNWVFAGRTAILLGMSCRGSFCRGCEWHVDEKAMESNTTSCLSSSYSDVT